MILLDLVLSSIMGDKSHYSPDLKLSAMRVILRKKK